jgi:hypothetical protein
MWSATRLVTLFCSSCLVAACLRCSAGHPLAQRDRPSLRSEYDHLNCPSWLGFRRELRTRLGGDRAWWVSRRVVADPLRQPQARRDTRAVRPGPDRVRGFIALRSRYGICIVLYPRVRKARTRRTGGRRDRPVRRHLVPVPTVASLAALNYLITAGDLTDDGRVITCRPVTITAAFDSSSPRLALPTESSDTARLLKARAESRSRSACGITTTPPRPAMRPTAAGASVGKDRRGAGRAAGDGPSSAALASTPRRSCIVDPQVNVIETRRHASGRPRR